MSAEMVEIYCKYRDYGWCAVNGQHPQCEVTERCSGPRVAAEKFADKLFGPGNYVLTRSSNKIYLCMRKQGL